jgi:growth hormone secretagogue receptor
MDYEYLQNTSWYYEEIHLNLSICKNSLIKEASLRITPFLVTIGVSLNLLTILIFCRKKLRNFVISIMMISLSIADCSVLLIPVGVTWYDEYYKAFEWLTESSWCSFHGYFDLVFGFMSAWITILISVERWFAVCRPWKKAQYFTKKHTLLAILFLFIFACSLALFFPLTVQNGFDEDFNPVCKRGSKDVHLVFGFISIALVYFIPFFVLAILNSQTMWTLKKRSTLSAFKYRKEKMKTTKRKIPANTKLCCLGKDRIDLDGTENIPMSSKLGNKTSTFEIRSCSRKERNLTITLLVIGITYMLLTLPYQIYWIYHLFNELKDYIDDIELMCIERKARMDFYELTFMCRNLNYVVNFILYSVLSKLFRSELSEVIFNINNFIKSKVEKISKQQFLK